MDEIPFDYDFERLIEAVAAGAITTENLPEQLYLKIADYLQKGLYEGYGGNLTDFPMYSPDHLLLKEMRRNIYMFSGAKTYQEVRLMSGILSAGKDVATFKQVREAAMRMLTTYNGMYLRTEYDTAIGQAQNARKWNQFEADKKYIKLLVYDAVIDANTSDICRPLDGIKLPVDHPFWNKHAPLNHFNCRCVLRVSVGNERQSSDARVQKAAATIDPEMQDVFKMNPGKDKVVFSDKHPYFRVAAKDKSRKKDNFGLPVPQ